MDTLLTNQMLTSDPAVLAAIAGLALLLIGDLITSPRAPADMAGEERRPRAGAAKISH